MRKHDPGGNLSILGFIVSSLCYADDIALIDKDPEAASARCTALAKSFWSHADMVIALKKTEAMIVRQRVKTDELTPLDYEHASLTHPCESCGRRFIDREGLAKHRRDWCGEAARDARTTKQEWEVERIVDAKGDASHRFYLVAWKGHAEHTWIPSRYELGAEGWQY